MDPPLDTARHLRYWQRCLRTLLPHQYTGNDSTRMTLGCFAVAAVDLLSPAGSSSSSTTAPPLLSPADRQKLRAWVLACQHPGGGFAGGPTHVYPRPAYGAYDFAAQQPAVGLPGEANIAATLFALQLLALLADPPGGGGGPVGGGVAASSAFCGVDRTATLQWLARLQRADGSFGEFLAEAPGGPAGGPAGAARRRTVAGGSDMRYCYIAAMIRWMLRGDVRRGTPAWVDDVDVPALVGHIRRGQTYDGGFAESATHESHAGYAFCAVAALALLDRPPEGPLPPPHASLLARGIADLPALVRWLASRSFLYKSGDDDDDDDDDDDEESIVTDVTPDALLQAGGRPLFGFNGRCNKRADSCYTWWTAGTLAILARHGLVPEAGAGAGPGGPDPVPVPAPAPAAAWEPSRRFLLEQTQHFIGGFAKVPRGPPDVYHSYLGLAALATRGEPGLKALDPAMSVSCDAVDTMAAARRSLLRGLGDEGRARRDALLKAGQACWAPA